MNMHLERRFNVGDRVTHTSGKTGTVTRTFILKTIPVQRVVINCDPNAEGTLEIESSSWCFRAAQIPH